MSNTDQKPDPKGAESKSAEQDILNKVLSLPEEAVLPWEEAVLPSEGLYYDNMIPDGRVKVRPMGLYAEKILATQRLAQSGQSLDWLFRHCVQLPEKFDPLNLLAGDRVFLLYYLRGITHGNMYEFIVRCTNEDCGQTTTSEYDLNNLQSTVIKPKHGLGSEPFKVVLPHLSKLSDSEFWVKIRLLRGYDMQSMLTQRRVGRKIQNTGRTANEKQPLHKSVDDTLEDNLIMLIVEAMGSANRAQIKELVGRMHASDTATIREFLRENSPGIDTNIVVNCSGCDQEMRMDLPITESFFRPTRFRSPRE